MRPACPDLPPVIGHRGAAARAPENTLGGFRRAHALSCTWVEFDVRLTADGTAVVCHDDKLDRTTGRSGRISAMTVAAVQAIDAGAPFDVSFTGERIPTLSQVMNLARELGLGTNIEIKAEPGLERLTAAAVVECLAREVNPLPPLLVSSFRFEALAAMKQLAPHYPRGLLLGELSRNWRALAEQAGCATIHTDHRRLRRDIAREVRDAGYPLLAYTVNDARRAAALFEWGVTSIFSDVPDIILAMITRTHLTRGAASAPATLSEAAT